MMEYVEMFKLLKDDINIYLMVLLSIVLVSNVIDWCFGWLNARFNSKVVFKSGKALYGIIKKNDVFYCFNFLQYCSFSNYST